MTGLATFCHALRRRPLDAIAGLSVEYAGYVATWTFVALLVATRSPLRGLDRRFGLRVRERVIELVARVSPG